jgi:hypothetical protein
MFASKVVSFFLCSRISNFASSKTFSFCTCSFDCFSAKAICVCLAFTYISFFISSDFTLLFRLEIVTLDLVSYLYESISVASRSQHFIGFFFQSYPSQYNISHFSLNAYPVLLYFSLFERLRKENSKSVSMIQNSEVNNV